MRRAILHEDLGRTSLSARGDAALFGAIGGAAADWPGAARKHSWLLIQSNAKLRD
jgi:hypothetical protein